MSEQQAGIDRGEWDGVADTFRCPGCGRWVPLATHECPARLAAEQELLRQRAAARPDAPEQA